MSRKPTGPDPWMDVSIPLRSGMPVWPGDPAVEVRRISSFEEGDDAQVSAIFMSSHTGTHLDAPAHFIRDGATMDDLTLDTVLGPARVIHLPAAARIDEPSLHPHDPRPGERLLLRTRNSESAWRSEEFFREFVHLTLSGAEYLAGRGIRLVGIDYLSVSGFHDDPAPVHRTLMESGVWILEGLNLSNVEPGSYDLVCLPLRLAGADGAPARALLRRRS